jgi:hypothetical protein
MMNFEQVNNDIERKGGWSCLGDGICGDYLFPVKDMVDAHF